MNRTSSLDRGWKFRRLPSAAESGSDWEFVDLPHTPFVADLDGRQHWFGECEYSRELACPAAPGGGRCALYVGAAMHSAVVLVDGRECGRHWGGYLPFEVDLTAALADGRTHTLTLRLDNRDSPDIPPGKPFADLDFCWYGGLYRNVELRCYPPVHITDPVGADAIASGGVFVRTLSAGPTEAVLSVQTHVCNCGSTGQAFDLTLEVLDGDRGVIRAQRSGLTLTAGTSAAFEQTVTIASPRLWQPDSPALYRARVTLRDPAGNPLDSVTERFGIRRIGFSRSGGFTINGQRMRLRGTNRHQEYPRVGYAVPASAQRRDARRIKEAGFDYVRLSHYPQSPAFLDACDELGIVVMNCLPGWQFIGGERFREACRQNARDMIRRDRNHPCVVLWELSLNETAMDEDFMAQLHAIGHEEYPGDQMFTCGWIDRYDVFIHARQHGQIHSWQNGDKALVISEYGDWEFYASNHGFDQKTGAGVYPAWRNARQRRAAGERGLRQQAHNHLIALSDTLSSPAVLDGQWAMFDYARGYDAHRAACGLMDIFRLPKFSYYFYRSQRDVREHGTGWKGGPVVFIASHWTAHSDLRVPVFTNCETVDLRLNGVPIERRLRATRRTIRPVPHPSFVFTVPKFVPGVLEATGYIDGVPVATHRVATPGPAERLVVDVDTAEVFAETGTMDVLIAHAHILDAAGTLCVQEASLVSFTAENAEIIGPATLPAEAGVASVVLRVPPDRDEFTLRATAEIRGAHASAHCVWSRLSPSCRQIDPTAMPLLPTG